MQKYFKYFFIVIISLIMTGTLHAEPVLRVGLLEVAPFVYEANGTYNGLAIDLWKIAANQQKWQYEYVMKGQNTQELLDALASGKIDVLVGNVSVTNKRIQHVDFSRPYYISSVGLMVAQEPRSFGELLVKIVTDILNLKFLFFLIFIVGASHFLWFFEARKRKSKQYKSEMKDVTWNTLLVFLTLSVGEYKSWYSRFLVVILLFSSLAFSGLIIATISSALTLSMLPREYNQLSDLGGQPVGVYVGSSQLDVAKSLGLTYKTYKNIDEAVDALEKNQVVGVIEEVSTAKFFLKQHDNIALELANFTLGYDEVSFAFPKNSPYLKNVNLEITILQDDRRLPEMCRKYIGEKEAELCGL